MVAVVVIEFSVMRCQPLRRALAAIEEENDPAHIAYKV